VFMMDIARGETVKIAMNPLYDDKVELYESPMVIEEELEKEDADLPPCRDLIRELQPDIKTSPVSDFDRLYSDLCLLNLSLAEIQQKY
jgi:hypothetical protein